MSYFPGFCRISSGIPWGRTFFVLDLEDARLRMVIHLSSSLWSHGMASHRNTKLRWGCRIWALLSGIATQKKDILFNWFADIIPTLVDSWFEEIFVPRCKVSPEYRPICFTLHVCLVALPTVLKSANKAGIEFMPCQCMNICDGIIFASWITLADQGNSWRWKI